ncbi:MAG: hypothetical protein FWG56_01300 [Desulfovibrionaceae bacterium]|nr:hypothetical protein [Desulfovibrionaceae bacterium]
MGSNPASRANKIKDLAQKWAKSFFYLRDFFIVHHKTETTGFEPVSFSPDISRPPIRR